MVLLAGCFGSRRAATPSPQVVVASTPPAPRMLTITLVGGPTVNDGNAVRVRLYQLQNDTAFRQATPAALWENDSAVLQAEKLESQEILLYPGETRTVELQAIDRASFVGVIAGFFRPDIDGWRTIVPVGAVPGDGLRLLLDASKISTVSQ